MTSSNPDHAMWLAIASIYESLPTQRERDNFAIMLQRWATIAYIKRLLALYEYERGTHG